jgi:hypothetical protein
MFQRNKQESGRSSYTKLLLVVFLTYLLIAFAHVAVTKRFDFPILVGDHSEAVFDLWSLQHFCAGILLASILKQGKVLRSWREVLAIVLFLELCWEGIELTMEAGLFGQAVAHWKNGFEHWSNRLIGDPLMVVVGAFVAKRFSQSWKIAFIPAMIWLFVNVLSPNGMHVQHVLFGYLSH